MESLGLVFLGLIALSSLVQGLFLLGLGWGGLRLMRRIQELQGRVEDELKPALASVSRITRNVSEVSEIASAQAQRVEALVEHTLARVDETKEQMREALSIPRGGLVEVAHERHPFPAGQVIAPHRLANRSITWSICGTGFAGARGP